MKSIVEVALELMGRKKPIFPVDRQKKPLINWKEFQKRIPSTEEIHAWWRQWPDANIGMATGQLSGVVIIDCDSNEATDRFVKVFPEANETLQVKTGRGRNFYFRFEDGIRNDAGKRLGDGIDIRGDGGYVVVPPSVHENGTTYQYDIPKSPARIPGKLREILFASPEREIEGVSGPAKANISKIPVGMRNQAVAQIGGLLRRLGLDREAIYKGLESVNVACCEVPLPDDELKRIAESVSRYDSPGTVASENPWERARPAPAFLAQREEKFQGIAKDLLAPGAITLIAAPRGLGKTQFSHALAVALATGGEFRGERVGQTRVLLVDRDNPSSVIKERLRSWGGHQTDNLHVLTRQDVPSLKDRGAWDSFPVSQYSAIIIDSLGSFTEGVTEKEGKQTTEVLATVLDLARKGIAVLILHNTTKDASSLRGRGELADRLDILYEVRDATGFVPSGKKPWWQELPEAGESAWADRAARRQKRIDYRLAFIASKFRLAEEPEPFCVELHLPKDKPWTLRDVTHELVKAGEDARAEVTKANQQRLDAASQALIGEVTKRQTDGNPILKSEAEDFLKEQGLHQGESRGLIKDKTGILWILQDLPGGRGKGNPIALLPLGQETNSITTTELQRNEVNTTDIVESGYKTNSVDSLPQSNDTSIGPNPEENSGTGLTPLLPSENGTRASRYRVKAPGKRPPSFRSGTSTSRSKKDGIWEEEL
jgi:hypothetical protein